MNHSRLLVLLPVILFACTRLSHAQDFTIVNQSSAAAIFYNREGPALDSIAAHCLAGDIERVTGKRPLVTTDVKQARDRVIVIGHFQSALVQQIIGSQASSLNKLIGRWEAFGWRVVSQPRPGIERALVIAGSDARGTAYGVFTLSEKIGVSPWYWWADVHPARRPELVLRSANYLSASPSVKYRGIFINDEDWGLQPWAAKTFEPQTGDIGPRTYARIFELLLRLKANLCWPAMHPSTKAFYHYAGNPEMAKAYGIVIGTSHAEPMMRNNVSEWDSKKSGPFNYRTNRDKVYRYWEERVRQTSSQEVIYSLGMRGVHDSGMEGVKEIEEAVPLVERIISEQRKLLQQYNRRPVREMPQAFTAYKEVLDIYDHGLKVPADVTIVWPDDNYGYIHRLNNKKEKGRPGGSGVYYHASYWGRPHDYLWLPSTHPGLLQAEMTKAFLTGADRLWVINVGDIKPIEYNIQHFLDMAYDTRPFLNGRSAETHLHGWINRLFGPTLDPLIYESLWEYYQLAFERRPEFMGWSRTEPTTPVNHTQFNHWYYGDEAQRRIDRYDALEQKMKGLQSHVEPRLADAFYQLVYYPIVCASWMNKKFLYRDKAILYARQQRWGASEFAARSQAAYDSIVKETSYYNTQLAGGKWNMIMSRQPRDLPVFHPPVVPELAIDRSNGWGIAVEGMNEKDSLLWSKRPGYALPAFNDLHRQRYFIDVYLSDSITLDWKAAASQPWIQLSQWEGKLLPQRGSSMVRLWVQAETEKLTTRNGEGAITISAGERQQTVYVQAHKLHNAALNSYKGFVENNGYLAFQALHFSRQTNKFGRHWSAVYGMGYNEACLLAGSLTDLPDSVQLDPTIIREKNAVVEYDFYTFTAAAPSFHLYTLPTHPLHSRLGMRYAISIDKGPLHIVDFHTEGRSEEWKQNVLRNRAERILKLPYLAPGPHTLQVYTIDPGVLLDEVHIDLGGLVKAYGALPETRIVIPGTRKPGVASIIGQ